MAVDLASFQAKFKNFGKLIYMSGMSDPVITAVRKAHMGLVDQVATGLASEFDLNQDVVSPLGNQVKSLADSLSKLPLNCKTAAQNYLTKFLAVDLGLTPGPSAAALQAAITEQMTAAGATVAPSGTNGSNSTGYAMYFATNLGIILPQDPSPTIPDAWIDDDVV